MSNRIPTRGVLLGCVLLIGTGGVRAQDWPQWRGPHRDAKATGFTAPQTWPKELTQKWKVTVGTGDATPALVGDRLYVFSRQGSDEVIRCLDAASGKEHWQDKYPAPAVQGAAGGHPGPRSSPAVAEGKVVTFGVGGTLSCLDAATGKVVWRKDTKAWPTFFTASSPMIVDGMCIAQIGGGRSDGAIVAYDLATGNEKWNSPTAVPGYSSPMLMTVDGTKLIIAETGSRGNDGIIAISAADGKRVWEAPCQTQYNASTPVVDGQTVIYEGGASGGGREGGGRGGREGGRGGRGMGGGRGGSPLKAVKLEKQGDKVAAKELWTDPDAAVQYNSPVAKDGVLYGLTGQQSHQLFAVNIQTGKTAWTVPGPSAGDAGGGRAAPGGGRGGRGGMGGREGGPGYGSVVDAGPVLLALAPGAQLVVFQPSDKEYKQLASYKVADGKTFAYPIVSGKRIYIKDTDSVILWTID